MEISDLLPRTGDVIVSTYARVSIYSETESICAFWSFPE